MLHVDFSRDNFAVRDVLEKTLNTILRNWERVYEREADDDTFAARFTRGIENAHAQTEQQVAVLADEYDKPMMIAIGASFSRAERGIKAWTVVRGEPPQQITQKICIFALMPRGIAQKRRRDTHGEYQPGGGEGGQER